MQAAQAHCPKIVPEGFFNKGIEIDFDVEWGRRLLSYLAPLVTMFLSWALERCLRKRRHDAIIRKKDFFLHGSPDSVGHELIAHVAAEAETRADVPCCFCNFMVGKWVVSFVRGFVHGGNQSRPLFVCFIATFLNAVHNNGTDCGGGVAGDWMREVCNWRVNQLTQLFTADWW